MWSHGRLTAHSSRNGRRLLFSRVTGKGACLSKGAVLASALLGLTAVAPLTLTPAPANAASSCPQGQVSAGSQVCLAKGDAQARQVLTTVKTEVAKYSLNATMFGVWRDGKVVAMGALGNSYPQVPAAKDMHFRIGNVTEAMECTLLLQLVEQGKISLDDPVSKWLPSLPHGNEITVGMVAASTSGYASYYTNQWISEYRNDPFRKWTPAQMTKIGTSQPLDFPPGTNFEFSDTNFTILGQILRKAGGAPVATQLKRMILDPLHLHNTVMTSTSYIPPPVLHGYDSARGDYQDSTFWSISWATYTANMSSDLTDMGRWAAALGTGRVLTAKMHERQFAPVSAKFKPFSKHKYPGLGAFVSNGWIISNPNVPGYWDVISYMPKQKLAVVLITTPTASSPPNIQYGVAMFNQVAAQLVPSSPPDMPFIM